MVIMPELDEKTKAEIEKIIGTTTGNQIRNIKMRSRQIVGLMVVLGFVGLIVWMVMEKPRSDKDVISNFSTTKLESEKVTPSSKSGLAALFELNETQVKLPHETLGKVIANSVYGLWSGEVKKKGLGFEGKILDGVAKPLADDKVMSKLKEVLSEEFKLVSFDSSGKALSETRVGFLNNNVPIKSDQGDWVGNLWMPAGTASVVLLKGTLELDKIFVDDYVPIVSILPVPATMTSAQSVQLSLTIGKSELPLRLSIDLVDIVKRQITTAISYEAATQETMSKEISPYTLGVTSASKYYIQVYLSSPFAVGQVKTNEFIYTK